MTELDKAVRDFREVRKKNIAWISRVQRITQETANATLFDVAGRRLKAAQVEPKLQEAAR